jgi:hypothetical protein
MKQHFHEKGINTGSGFTQVTLGRKINVLFLEYSCRGDSETVPFYQAPLPPPPKLKFQSFSHSLLPPMVLGLLNPEADFREAPSVLPVWKVLGNPERYLGDCKELIQPNTRSLTNSSDNPGHCRKAQLHYVKVSQAPSL